MMDRKTRELLYFCMIKGNCTQNSMFCALSQNYQHCFDKQLKYQYHEATVWETQK